MSASNLFGGSKQEAGGVLNRLPAIRPGARTARGSGLTTDLDFQVAGDQLLLRNIDVDTALDPQVQRFRKEAVQGARGLIRDVQGDIQTLRGLDNPFIQARVAPFVEQREQARRAAARRGVTGPLASLATNPFTAEIANQRALAQREALDAVAQRQQLVQGLFGDISGEGALLAQQELAQLGLSQQEIQDIISSQLNQQQETGTLRERPNLVTGAGQIAGGLGGLLGAFCWVAREVYGPENPKWLQFRSWLFTSSPVWLFRFYVKHGERFARWVSNKPIIKRLIRWAMDKAIDNGKR